MCLNKSQCRACQCVPHPLQPQYSERYEDHLGLYVGLVLICECVRDLNEPLAFFLKPRFLGLLPSLHPSRSPKKMLICCAHMATRSKSLQRGIHAQKHVQKVLQFLLPLLRVGRRLAPDRRRPGVEKVHGQHLHDLRRLIPRHMGQKGPIRESDR